MKKIIYTIFAVFLIFTSCSDSFIEIASENDLTTDSFYETSDDFNAAVLGA